MDEPKLTSLVIVGTYDDGQTFATTFPEPEKADFVTEWVEGQSFILGTDPACLSEGKPTITITIIPGKRGLIRVTTPIPGT